MSVRHKVIASLVIYAGLLACIILSNNNNTNNMVESTANDGDIVVSITTPSTLTSFEDNNFPNAPSDDGAIEVYRKEVFERIKNVNEKEEDFTTRAEKKILERYDYNVFGNGVRVDAYNIRHGELNNYFYPVLYTGKNGVELWYTNQYGALCRETVTGKNTAFTNNYYGNVHYSGDVSQIINRQESLCVVYEPDSGRVSLWFLGEITSEYYVPENSIYVGLSELEGYIFRDGTDVYCVKDVDTYASESGAAVIAHNVKEVIMANYCMSNDEWSQPLFLMTDGTLKVYSRWYGYKDAALNHESHLESPRYEGGYGK